MDIASFAGGIIVGFCVCGFLFVTAMFSDSDIDVSDDAKSEKIVNVAGSVTVEGEGDATEEMIIKTFMCGCGSSTYIRSSGREVFYKPGSYYLKMTGVVSIKKKD